jgi:hypothetical protein
MPVNWPTSPLSTKERAFHIEVDGGSLASGISSIFLPNLVGCALEFLAKVETITWKAMASKSIPNHSRFRVFNPPITCALFSKYHFAH